MFKIKGDRNIIHINICEIVHFLNIFVRFLTFPDVGTPASSFLNCEILHQIFLNKITTRNLLIHYIFYPNKCTRNNWMISGLKSALILTAPSYSLKKGILCVNPPILRWLLNRKTRNMGLMNSFPVSLTRGVKNFTHTTKVRNARISAHS